ncbi:MAG: response regulator transcription factor [Bacillota bacterium]
MKVLIADDQADVRCALRILLENKGGPFAFAEAEGLKSLFEETESEKPDLVLLDWELSGQTMDNVIPVLRRIAPDARIIALSVYPEAEKAAIKAGADAFASKGENPDKLLDIIRSDGLAAIHEAR